MWSESRQFAILSASASFGRINWAPSSEFVSLSIPSWQILTANAQPFRGPRDLAFCLKVPLDSLLVWTSSGGSGKTAQMRRLAWTFAARMGDKYQIRLTRPSVWYNLVVQILWSFQQFFWMLEVFQFLWSQWKLVGTTQQRFMISKSYTSVADQEGVRRVQMNPIFSLNHFIFMGNFRKNWSNCTNRHPPPPQLIWITIQKSWICPCTCIFIRFKIEKYCQWIYRVYDSKSRKNINHGKS